MLRRPGLRPGPPPASGGLALVRVGVRPPVGAGGQLADAPVDWQVAAFVTAARQDRARSSDPANSTTKARISECSVQAACGMSAGQTAASPAAIRVHSSPTLTQPPPSTTTR